MSRYCIHTDSPDERSRDEGFPCQLPCNECENGKLACPPHAIVEAEDMEEAKAIQRAHRAAVAAQKATAEAEAVMAKADDGPRTTQELEQWIRDNLE